MAPSNISIDGPSQLQLHEASQPEDGRITRLADDLVWYRFRMPFRLNHINLFALETEDGWLLIDAGINTKDTQLQWDAILPQLIAHRRIAGIIITHHHHHPRTSHPPFSSLTQDTHTLAESESSTQDD